MFNFSTCVKYRPYVGTQFGSDGVLGLPFLLLGKKHYNVNMDPDVPEFTDIVVKRHLSGVDRQSYLDLVTRAVIGNNVNEQAEKCFWRSIAFYNYIQDMMDDSSTEPTAESWSNAATPFDEVVRALQPKCILVIGKPLFRRLACDQPSRIAHANVSMETCSRGNALMGGIHSPPIGFSPAAWHPCITQLLEIARLR